MGKRPDREIPNALYVTEEMDEASALTTFCLVAMNLNEFLYVD